MALITARPKQSIKIAVALGAATLGGKGSSNNNNNNSSSSSQWQDEKLNHVSRHSRAHDKLSTR